jgi:ABC-type taurine transport system substrate-binding protein
MPFTITPIAQDYIDKHPELIENYSKQELESMYKRYNNPFY